MSLLLPFTLATILTTDPLGYECVPEDRLEAAFALGGKGMRAPQTCIPEPCEQTLTEATLASYSGYRDAALYSDYRRRMSGVCGTPTLWEEKGITDEELLWAVFDGDSGPIPIQKPEKWTAAALEATDTLQTVTFAERGRSRFGGGGGGFWGGGGGSSPRPGKPGGTPTIDSLQIVDPTGERFPEIEPEIGPELPSQVPLPAPFFLLSAGAAALVLLKRVRRLGRST